MERCCPDNSKKYRLISVGDLWAEQFAIEIDVLNRRFWNFLENCDFEISIIFLKIDRFQSWIAQLTYLSHKWVNILWKENVLTILKSTGSFLWEVCEPSNLQLKSINFMKNYGNFKNHNFPENFKICDSIHRFQSQITRLTDDPLKWACTFWNPQDILFPQSIDSFLWVVCGLRN